MAARDLALVQLDRLHLPGWRSNLLRARGAFPANGRDLGLAEQIRIGTIKNLILLRHLVTHYSGRSLKSIDPLVQKILVIALYQLRFLERIPASAAVDEAVEQTRRFGRPKASGFVNAVLRRATREPEPALPDHSDPLEYARLVLSHPRELVDRLAHMLSSQDLLRFAEHDNREPPTLVRLFQGVDSAKLAVDEVRVLPHQQSGIYVLESARQATLAELARNGIAQVQDATAAAVVEALDLQRGQTVLDRCAGFGTKTLQLRERVGDAGTIVAVEPQLFRLNALRRQLEQRGWFNVRAVQAARMDQLPPDTPRQFERILVDAPCSNSGVLARRAEARFHQATAALQSLQTLQMDILADTAPALQPGGRLLYSTCSVWPEENQGLVEAFLREQTDFELLQQQTTLPSFDADPSAYHDGGFWALLRRRS